MHVLRYGAESRLKLLRYAMHVLSYGAESRKPSQCIKIVNACIEIWSQCIKVGDACVMIWNRVFSALCDSFRHCEIFSKKFQKFMSGPPARFFVSPAEICYACGYCFDLMLCKKIVVNFKRVN